MTEQSNPIFTSTSRYYVATFIAVVGWGLSTTFVEFGLNYVNKPYLFLALRFLTAVIIITPVMLVFKLQEVKKLMKSRWPYIIAMCETFGLIFQYLGQQTDVAAGLASLLTMMFILIVPFLSKYFLHEKFYLNHGLAIIIGLIGVIFIVTEGDFSRLVSSSTTGIILLLLSALSYAFYQIATSKLTREVNTDTDSFALFYIVMVLITGYSLLTALLNSDTNLNISWQGWLWIFLLAIFSTIIAFIAYFEASKGLPANTLSILLISQMLVPFFVDIFILRINYSIWVYVGGFIIVIGMIFVTRTPVDGTTKVDTQLNQLQIKEPNIEV